MSSIESIINRQIGQWELQIREKRQPPPTPVPISPIVTVSREHGSQGAYFAHMLAERLGFQLMHKEIIETIADTSGYRKRLIAALDEKYKSQLQVMVQSLLTGQAVDHNDYNRHLYATILSMSRLGGVILVGRGGNFIIGPQRGFHLRFVCPIPIRIENLIKYKNLNRAEAEKAIERIDNERRDMVRKLFKADIDNPHYYDLLINTATVDLDAILPVMVDLINSKLKKMAKQAG